MSEEIKKEADEMAGPMASLDLQEVWDLIDKATRAETKRCALASRSYKREGSSFPDGEVIAQIIEGSAP